MAYFRTSAQVVKDESGIYEVLAAVFVLVLVIFITAWKYEVSFIKDEQTYVVNAVGACQQASLNLPFQARVAREYFSIITNQVMTRNLPRRSFAQTSLIAPTMSLTALGEAQIVTNFPPLAALSGQFPCLLSVGGNPPQCFFYGFASQISANPLTDAAPLLNGDFPRTDSGLIVNAKAGRGVACQVEEDVDPWTTTRKRVRANTYYELDQVWSDQNPPVQNFIVAIAPQRETDFRWAMSRFPTTPAAAAARYQPYDPLVNFVPGVPQCGTTKCGFGWPSRNPNTNAGGNFAGLTGFARQQALAAVSNPINAIANITAYGILARLERILPTRTTTALYLVGSLDPEQHGVAVGVNPVWNQPGYIPAIPVEPQFPASGNDIAQTANYSLLVTGPAPAAGTNPNYYSMITPFNTANTTAYRTAYSTYQAAAAVNPPWPPGIPNFQGAPPYQRDNVDLVDAMFAAGYHIYGGPLSPGPQVRPILTSLTPVGQPWFDATVDNTGGYENGLMGPLSQSGGINDDYSSSFPPVFPYTNPVPATQFWTQNPNTAIGLDNLSLSELALIMGSVQKDPIRNGGQVPPQIQLNRELWRYRPDFLGLINRVVADHSNPTDPLRRATILLIFSTPPAAADLPAINTALLNPANLDPQTRIIFIMVPYTCRDIRFMLLNGTKTALRIANSATPAAAGNRLVILGPDPQKNFPFGCNGVANFNQQSQLFQTYADEILRGVNLGVANNNRVDKQIGDKVEQDIFRQYMYAPHLKF